MNKEIFQKLKNDNSKEVVIKKAKRGRRYTETVFHNGKKVAQLVITLEGVQYKVVKGVLC